MSKHITFKLSSQPTNSDQPLIVRLINALTKPVVTIAAQTPELITVVKTDNTILWHQERTKSKERTQCYLEKMAEKYPQYFTVEEK